MTAATMTAERFPKKLLIAAGVLIALTLTSVLWSRIEQMSEAPLPSAAPLVERSLRFEDRADGSITVLDGQTKHEIARVSPGTNGFLRSTLRGMARDRKRRDLSSEQPFVLSIRSDGRLSLGDAATGRYIDLEAFGPTNANVFRQFLPASNPPPEPAPGIVFTQPVTQPFAKL
jgi:putative photosynthetic complex assembly protein